jgi:parallel beta-helix repeat protein
MDGVFVNGGSNNILDANTIDSNLSSGLTLFSTKSNVLSANTTDLNGIYGAFLEQATSNTVVDFSASGNGQVGFYAGCGSNGPDNAACTPASNASTNNTIVNGVTSKSDSSAQNYGVALDLGDIGNIVTGIFGSQNSINDAFDANANCSTNRWGNNSFVITNPSCIH